MGLTLAAMSVKIDASAAAQGSPTASATASTCSGSRSSSRATSSDALLQPGRGRSQSDTAFQVAHQVVAPALATSGGASVQIAAAASPPKPDSKPAPDCGLG